MMSPNQTQPPSRRGPTESNLVQALEHAFPEASYLDVINESAGHAVPAGSESHFRIIVVSRRFEGMSRLARHRMVQQALAAPAAKVKAIAMRPFTPEEWQQGEGQDAAPHCRGGDV